MNYRLFKADIEDSSDNENKNSRVKKENFNCLESKDNLKQQDIENDVHQYTTTNHSDNK